MKAGAPALVICLTGVLAGAELLSPRVVLEVPEADLRQHLGVISHDSMEGRPTGSPALERVAAYVESELRRSKVAPGGNNGSYYQVVPLVRMQMDPQSFVTVNRQRAHFDVDFLPIVGVFGLNTPWSVRVPERDKVHGGRLGTKDVIKPADAMNKFVFFYAPFRPNGQPDYQLWAVRNQLLTYRNAAAIGIISLHLTPQSFRNRLTQPQWVLRDTAYLQPSMPPIFSLSYFVEDWWGGSGGPTEFARDTAAVVAGVGKNELTFAARSEQAPRPARNIVAKIEGSDPNLRSQFVVLSAHIDHLGIAREDDRVGTDSIYNGANDGSGAVALLAIARAMQVNNANPKRSILFVWTVGEEQGFLGSQYFVNHPPATRDSIVANITLDMIGGGKEERVTLYGAERDAGVFGNIVEEVNRRSTTAFRFYREASADSVLCGGDDWHFARWGIPSVRLSTERGIDYHRVTDEIAGINFPVFARAATFAAELAMEVADRSSVPPRTLSSPQRVCAR